jgi:hypothetical protein
MRSTMQKVPSEITIKFLPLTEGPSPVDAGT